MRGCSRLGGLALAISMVATMVVASCSRNATSPSTPSATPAQSVAATKPSGSLVIATNTRGTTMDPQEYSGSAFAGVPAAVFDSLIELTPEGQPRPGLAERSEISDDGLTQTFYIRKGVKFHDGSDLTGADVKFSMERLLSPKSRNLDAPVWRALVDSVELKDAYTVVFHTKRPMFEFMKGLQDYTGAGAVVPKKYIEEKGEDYFIKNPIGSGPFRVVSYQTGVRYDIEANENYWDPARVPLFKKITVMQVGEEGTKVAMLKTGELDIGEVSPDSVPGLEAAGMRTISWASGNASVVIPFFDVEYPEKYALGDVRVRKALSLALDRKQLADKIYGGYAEPSAMAYARPSAYFWDASVLKPDPYDPEQAKKLLVEAGYPNGFNMKIWDASGGAGAIANVLQAESGYWRNIGLKTEIQAIEYSALGSRLKNPPAEMMDSVWSHTVGAAPFQFEKLALTYHTKKAFKPMPANPRLDELIDQVPLTKDPAEKKKLALEAATLAKNGYSIVGVLEVNLILAIGRKVGNLTPIQGVVSAAPFFATITHPN